MNMQHDVLPYLVDDMGPLRCFELQGCAVAWLSLGKLVETVDAVVDDTAEGGLLAQVVEELL